MYFEGIVKCVRGISMHIYVFKCNVCRLTGMYALGAELVSCNPKPRKVEGLKLSGGHCCHLLLSQYAEVLHANSYSSCYPTFHIPHHH
jgi:hypothetical protein